nr:MAG TPA: hypothetical protein [Caudoviricetes sp.]
MVKLLNDYFLYLRLAQMMVEKTPLITLFS